MGMEQITGDRLSVIGKEGCKILYVKSIKKYKQG